MELTGTIYPSGEQIESMQNQKLMELMEYLSIYSPFYRQLFRKNNIIIPSISSVSDLQQIPTTSKEDLQQFNDDFLCVPIESVVEYCSTSGTLGKPVTIALTEKDLHRLAYNEYNTFKLANGGPGDIYQLMLTLDRQFMAGIAYHSGLRKLGAGIIRLGPGVPSMQWETIQKLKPTAIVAVPSFILKLVQYAMEQGIDVNATSVKKAICIGENIRNADLSLNELGRRITEVWDIDLYSTYASTEMQTAFTECKPGSGGHLQPDLVIVELLDEQGAQVAAGEPGEVTITTLGIEGMPLLRYRTGDICRYINEPCSCGRESIRLSPVICRKQQMIKFKGTTLYPPALFDLLNGIKEVSDHVIEVYSNEVGLDELVLYLHAPDFHDELNSNIRAYLQARIRVIPHLKFVSSDEMKKMQMPETGRKIIKFIDRRIRQNA